MDSDDLMCDSIPATNPITAGPSNMNARDSSQCDAQAAAAAAAAANNCNSGPGAWNTKKFRDEYDAVKSRLTDPKFSSASYPDPLLRGESRARKSSRADVLAERERILKEVIAQAKTSIA